VSDRATYGGTGAVLVSAPVGTGVDDRDELSRLVILKAVVRRLLPLLFEATLVPAALFYVFLEVSGPGTAILAALFWSYGAVLRRLVTRRPIPAILALGCVGLAARTVFALASGSTFVYFLQPIGTTLALAAVFLGSLLFGKPLVSRMAHDFCPMAPDVAARPRVMRLLSGLTVLWACVHLATAAMTFGLLVTLPVSTFVVMKTAACLTITMTAIVSTVAWSVHIANAEKLVFASVSTP
jgi:hypothetical protein